MSNTNKHKVIFQSRLRLSIQYIFVDLINMNLPFLDSHFLYYNFFFGVKTFSITIESMFGFPLELL